MLQLGKKYLYSSAIGFYILVEIIEIRKIYTKPSIYDIYVLKVLEYLPSSLNQITVSQFATGFPNSNFQKEIPTDLSPEIIYQLTNMDICYGF